MSEACEDFLRGQGRLAGLLWELSPYEPPASLEASFLAAASAAQQQANARKAAAAATAFEAPAQMAARFSQLAAQADAAQATRREAVLSQIAAGDSPEAVLGATVQPETADWLRQQASAAKPAKPKRQPVLWGFSWFDLRLAALAGVLAAVSTQWLLQHGPSPAERTLLEAFLQVQQDQRPLAEAQPDQPQNRVSAAPAPARPAAAPPPAPASADTAPAPHEASRAPLSAAEETPALAETTQPAPKLTMPREAHRELHDSRTETVSAAPPAILAARKAAPPAAAEPAVDTPEGARMAAATAAPAPAARTPLPAKPAPAAIAADGPAPAEAPARARSPAPAFKASLGDDPAAVAARLPALRPDQHWLILHAPASAPALQAWLEKLRAAMPASPPPRFRLQTAPELPAERILIQPAP